jgi:hypothetical protein
VKLTCEVVMATCEPVAYTHAIGSQVHRFTSQVTVGVSPYVPTWPQVDRFPMCMGGITG